jgi:hypothetical protein
VPQPEPAEHLLTRLDHTTIALIGGLCLLTAASFLWLSFMVWKPDRWGAFVDWEYNFWVRRGVLSSALAEKCKRLEKGSALKWLVGATVLLGAGFLVITGLLLLRS